MPMAMSRSSWRRRCCRWARSSRQAACARPSDRGAVSRRSRSNWRPQRGCPSSGTGRTQRVDYAQASEWLETLTNPERTGLTRRFGQEMSLDATRRLMALLGNPHERITAVHIAGTKGKGSVAAMVEAVCRAAGHRTGLFTSPHLVSWRERIRIDGRCINEQLVADLADEVRPAVEQVEAEGLRGPSFFKALTAMGMLAFAREDLDICVLETGLGGRLDATNVMMPEVSVITTLGLDHTEILGDTLAEIAMQKAGIIKHRVPVVVAPQPKSIERLLRRVAEGQNASLHVAEPFDVLEADRLSPDDVTESALPVLGECLRGQFRGEPVEVHLPLVGRHQAINAGVASLACEALNMTGAVRLPPGSVGDGLARVYWPARVELVGARPWEVLDCAHNQESAQALVSALGRHLEYDRLLLVLGASRDKPVEAMAQELSSADHVILTEASLSRAMSAEELAERTGSSWTSAEIVTPCTAALKRARELAGARDLICVTGSVFVAGELIEEGMLETQLCGL
ncbi:MAG: bifunctional folylpolyglutamate synthase/dihydrofolate synthase [Armatimonadia bacterium]|nr:bifunctional folylpolyglutamate synthase/dihydrofolate synthase [Armatimonadia bacterium]